MGRCHDPGCEKAALEGSNYCADHVGQARPPSPSAHPPRRSGRAPKPSHVYVDVPVQAPNSTTMPDPVKILERLNRAVTARTRRKPKRKRK